ncbi:MAG: NAD(P)-dependent oxidoreductase [Pseudomonadota bacterium]
MTQQITNTLRRVLVTGGSGFIGTNYIAHLQTLGPSIAILNLDTQAPQNHEQKQYWQECDITQFSVFREKLIAFNPTEVIHLAARTDTDSEKASDYYCNIEGTENLLQLVAESENIERLIVTSTQFVKRPGSLPDHDTDFDPHTAYGESKVVCEQRTRQANLNCCWTIVRPTNIWGPWHPRYPNEFWRVLKKGWYFHPGGRSAVRSYGYVDNIVYQLESILVAEPEEVNGKVFYVSDEAIQLIDWVNGFSLALTGRKVRVLPRWFIRSLAGFGDLLSYIGVTFPITTSRFRSMTTDDLVPIAETITRFGTPPIPLDEGIKRSVDWLKTQDYFK